MRKLSFVAAACAVALATALAPAAAHPRHSDHRHGGHHHVTVTTIATGLDSPRGLALLRDGTLLVAEAGHGGDVHLPSNMGSVGLTGQVSRVNRATGAHTPVVTRLTSFLDPEGGAIGIDGLSTVRGRAVLGIMGIYPQAAAQIDCSKVTAADCPQVAAAAQKQLGGLLLLRHGGYRKLADVGGYDYQFTVENPGGATYGSEEDANPYGVLAGHHGAWVADAGSNTLTWASYRGHVHVVHRFPVPDKSQMFPSDAVPTCVARSGHHLVVADLAGRIWAVGGHGARKISGPSAPYTGGPHYTGCASDRWGHVYVVSMFTGTVPDATVANTGSVVKVERDGHVRPVRGASGLNFPNGITVGRHGALYVSVGSISPNGGIVKISR